MNTQLGLSECLRVERAPLHSTTLADTNVKLIAI